MKKISTRSMKLVTALFLVMGFGLMLAGPWVVHRPSTMHRKAYAQRAALYVGGFVIAIAGAGLGAFLLVRRAKSEYKEQSLENLKAILEAARVDQLKASTEAKPTKSLLGEPINPAAGTEIQDDA